MSEDAASTSNAAGTTATTAPPDLTLGDEFAQLGTTTSTRGWVAFSAVAVLVAGFLVWGVFGTISVQTSMPATIINGSLPAVVSAPVEGYIVSGANVDQQIPAGQAVAVIRPYDGGADVPATVPFDFAPSAYNVFPGSPVKVGDIVARGSAVAPDGTADKNIAAVAYVPYDQIAMLQTAVGISVTNTAPGTSGQAVSVTLRSIDTSPSTQSRVAEVTGNALYAEEVYQASGGAPYLAIFEYADGATIDSSRPGGATGTLTVVEWSDSPLQVLFGG